MNLEEIRRQAETFWIAGHPELSEPVNAMRANIKSLCDRVEELERALRSLVKDIPDEVMACFEPDEEVRFNVLASELQAARAALSGSPEGKE